MRDFTRAVNVDARFAAGYRNRAEAKLEVEHYEEAIEDLSRAVAFDVRDAETYLLRGQAYLATKNTASAIKDFSQAIELNPKLAPAYAARGLANGLAEAFEEAFADLNKAIELDPRSSTAFAYRAFIYKQTGQLDVGLRDIETAVKVDAEKPEVYWAKAEIEEAQGQLELAIADLRRALVLRPGYRDAIDSLQRLGAMPSVAEEEALPGAGIEDWRVVKRAGRYYAMNDKHPRLTVPLEMSGEGQPRLLEWEIKKAPFKGIGVLRFFAGTVSSREGSEEMEFIAVLDLEESKVIAIEPHRQGKKVAAWTWEEGKITVASVDGVTDELPVRVGKDTVAGASRRYTSSEQGFAPWAPWAEPWAGGGSARSKPRTAKKKYKSIFDLLFN
jgi:tetratricopeptide (TPR) repeat protein